MGCPPSGSIRKLLRNTTNTQSTQPLLICPLNPILPMTGLPPKGALQDGQLPLIEKGGILVAGGKILQVDAYDTLRSGEFELHPVGGNAVCLPGLVDSHTHICFAGDRARDYALRNAGRSYLEIAKTGGGIWDTVTQTRRASGEQLVEGILARCREHLKKGVTTLEVK